MNTLISAYNFGNTFSKTYLGNQLYGNYSNIQKSISNKAWGIYRKAVFVNSENHYFSFKLAFERIKYLSEKEEGFYKEIFDELNSCSELHLLMEESERFGGNLQDLIDKMINNTPTASDFNLMKSSDLYRVGLDLFYCFQSTKFLIVFHEYKINSKKNYSIIDKYLQERIDRPFSTLNRNLIQKIMKSELDQKLMNVMEFLDGFKSFVPRLIFDIHFDNVYKVNDNETTLYRERIINDFRIFSFKKMGLDFFNSRYKFILIFDDNIIKDIGYIKKIKINNMELGPNATSFVYGVLYPTKDYNIFLTK